MEDVNSDSSVDNVDEDSLHVVLAGAEQQVMLILFFL